MFLYEEMQVPSLNCLYPSLPPPFFFSQFQLTLVNNKLPRAYRCHSLHSWGSSTEEKAILAHAHGQSEREGTRWIAFKSSENLSLRPTQQLRCAKEQWLSRLKARFQQPWLQNTQVFTMCPVSELCEFCEGFPWMLRTNTGKCNNVIRKIPEVWWHECMCTSIKRLVWKVAPATRPSLLRFWDPRLPDDKPKCARKKLWV